MHRKYTFRAFTPEDQEAVFTLILSILETEFNDIPPEGYLLDVRDIPTHYDGERNQFFVCEYEGQIVGTIAVKEDDKKTALMRRLFVNPHFRGKQVGKRLLDAALTFCLEKKYKKILFAGNTRMNLARKLLLRNGFVETEHFQLDNLDIFRLQKDLSA